MDRHTVRHRLYFCTSSHPRPSSTPVRAVVVVFPRSSRARSTICERRLCVQNLFHGQQTRLHIMSRLREELDSVSEAECDRNEAVAGLLSNDICLKTEWMNLPREHHLATVRTWDASFVLMARPLPKSHHERCESCSLQRRKGSFQAITTRTATLISKSGFNSHFLSHPSWATLSGVNRRLTCADCFDV